MANRVTYYNLTCACGFRGFIATSRWSHRDELVQRAACTAWGRRRIKSMVVVAEGSGGFISEIKPELAGLIVQKV